LTTGSCSKVINRLHDISGGAAAILSIEIVARCDLSSSYSFAFASYQKEEERKRRGEDEDEDELWLRLGRAAPYSPVLNRQACE
jgi:hypothetical protein